MRLRRWGGLSVRAATRDHPPGPVLLSAWPAMCQATHGPGGPLTEAYSSVFFNSQTPEATTRHQQQDGKASSHSGALHSPKATHPHRGLPNKARGRTVPLRHTRHTKLPVFPSCGAERPVASACTWTWDTERRRGRLQEKPRCCHHRGRPGNGSEAHLLPWLLCQHLELCLAPRKDSLRVCEWVGGGVVGR